MRFPSVFLAFTFILFSSPAVFAQDEQPSKHEPSEQEHGHSESENTKPLRNALGLTIGHTHVSTGFQDGDSKWLALPSFGLHYAYSLHEKWAIAIHSEMIVEDFVVKGSGGEGKTFRNDDGSETSVIERGRPVAIALVGMYRIHKHITLLAGGGMEFSEHENFGLVKFGADFPYHFAHNWELFGTLSVDLKLDAYNSFSFGFGVAKLF